MKGDSPCRELPAQHALDPETSLEGTKSQRNVRTWTQRHTLKAVSRNTVCTGRKQKNWKLEIIMSTNNGNISTDKGVIKSRCIYITDST